MYIFPYTPVSTTYASGMVDTFHMLQTHRPVLPEQTLEKVSRTVFVDPKYYFGGI